MTGAGDATRFRWLLLGCCVVGLAVRLGLGWHTSTDHLGSDTPFFRDGAAELVDSGRYTVQRGSGALTTTVHPPAFVLVLAAGEVVGLDTVAGQRALMALIGVAGVAFVGLAGFRLRGTVAGTVAAAIAAVHPMWVQPGVVLMSESLHLTVVAAALLMALRHLDRPSPVTAAAAAALISAAALVRSEALVALVLMAPVLVLLRGIPRRTVLRLALGFGVGAALVLGPWVVRNTIVSGSPVMSTNAGVTLAGANCDQTHSGDHRGGFNLRCALGPAAVAQFEADAEPGPEREVQVDASMRQAAIDDARTDPGRTLVTAVHRVLRTWTPLHLESQVHLDTAEGRLPRWQAAGRWLHGLLLVPAAFGTVALLRGSRRRAAVVLVFVVQVTVTVAVVYGSARMRVGAEPSIALLAGVGVAVVAARLRRRPAPDGGGPVATPDPATV